MSHIRLRDVMCYLIMTIHSTDLTALYIRECQCKNSVKMDSNTMYTSIKVRFAMSLKAEYFPNVP